MHKLIQGIHRFKADVFNPRRDFFAGLVDGQRPQALFITCSDSRLVPDLICQTDPGDLFVIRNAGNIVPSYVPGVAAGEAATIEYAVKGLGIKDIVVCGHTRCGAMYSVLNPDSSDGMPRVRQWLANSDAAAEIVCTCYHQLPDDARWNVLVQENVLVQIENLRTHPAVQAGLAAGEVRLHAWVYKMETGQVFAFDPVAGQFTPLEKGDGAVVPAAVARGGAGASRAGLPLAARAI